MKSFKDTISSGICFKINGSEIKSASVPKQNMKTYLCQSAIMDSVPARFVKHMKHTVSGYDSSHFIHSLGVTLITYLRIFFLNYLCVYLLQYILNSVALECPQHWTQTLTCSKLLREISVWCIKKMIKMIIIFTCHYPCSTER